MMRNSTLFGLALVLCASVPARAEIDLSGSLASINHEDALERGSIELLLPGPPFGRARFDDAEVGAQ